MLAATTKQGLRGSTQVARAAAGAAGQTREMSSLVDKVKEFFMFAPNRSSYETFPDSKKSKIGKGYRYPSPGTQSQGAFTPIKENDEDPYDTNYYTRDTARNMQEPLYIHNDKAAQLHLPKAGEEPPRSGSPGNKNPAVLRYDPSGTRSAMASTWEGLDSKLKENLPIHLPMAWSEWENIDVVAEAKAKGIPPPPGKPAPWTGPTKEVQEGSW
ncbi:Hypothetical Protein FCC1311_006282 [Hondaea fermentalgiana]|uniref:Uncharacterized protein n=1 Tax=Hondaea fermentalgiana TaxID=2315210 RepID=A0A2R5G086_9STRA|nr:Hypothetical Protein FCC1311_006282 [Hondaea fermentalgiana]|eukprot:GBG24410.1 Hypothetical Protein FCC1311_006282 [Hondaea fermentalgiana]